MAGRPDAGLLRKAGLRPNWMWRSAPSAAYQAKAIRPEGRNARALRGEIEMLDGYREERGRALVGPIDSAQIHGRSASKQGPD